MNSRNMPDFSEGIPNMPRRKSFRERIGDVVYRNLQFLSRVLFIIAGLLGYYSYNIYGLVVGGIMGWFIGVWMRYSMGIRKADPATGFHGFFVRKREIARGAKRGVLEWLIEKIRGNEFSQSKCLAITKAYEQAVYQLGQCSSPIKQKEILMELDRKLKEISYD